MSVKELVDRYCRTNKLPHIWCPGCGNGIIMGAIIRALDKTGFDQIRLYCLRHRLLLTSSRLYEF